MTATWKNNFKGEVCPFWGCGGHCTRTPYQNCIYFVFKFMGIHAHALEVCRKSETEIKLQIKFGFHSRSFALAHARTHTHTKVNDKQLHFNNAGK